MTITADRQRRWFIDVWGGWHRQSRSNIAVCGALAAPGVGPWLDRPPANGVVCADCEDDP
ncbi:hypothetical protein [Jiangella sp. DSM 45060]|uniref:hypothetical protein n=1 Tax=Jiangella sp. DSM 45060 TaxID=1798224 RepID=UPI000879803D|nr:hypothetical protein [Jiangella sp. DSM 45060]SDT69561.1 hypothetical protein SAMN04515669_6039 [Jiangella sp. DSM 45060]